MLKRFTPTYVGTTVGGLQVIFSEKRFTPTYVGTTFRSIILRNRERRFTPTYVGTTLPMAVRVGPLGGSPPRMWGQR